MGVPSLYKWLSARYPEIKESLNSKDEYTTDAFYLDFNAIIHPCCNKTLSNMRDTDQELYRNLEIYLDLIMDRIRPGKLLYISIDGVAPRAKLNQQRARRFTYAQEITQEDKKYFKDDCGSIPLNPFQKEQAAETFDSKEVFDANAITPGTEFMMRLDCFIQELIAYKMSTNERWKHLNVILSGFRIPGEGEQKIMEYIRKHHNKKDSLVIFSPDADLIFLGLTLFDYNVMILREEYIRPGENAGEEKKFALVNIPTLRKLLIRGFQGVIKINFDHRRFLEDWVFLCFTVGNDFIPCSPCFEIRTNALDKLTMILTKVFLKTKSFITDHGKIKFNILIEFFKFCAEREDEFISQKRINLITSRQKMNLPYEVAEEFYLENERGKTRFYVEKMGVKSEQELLDACKEYIRGLQWIYSYYFYDIPSWDWYYPYHYAPFMVDLASIKEFPITFNPGRPLKPLEQLLNVLPKLSKDLLPECLGSIFDQFKEYYPTEFKLDMFQKIMDWQAIPILPFMKCQDIVKAYEEKQNLLTFEEADRNIAGYPIFFSRQPRLIAKIYPMYNELKTCEHIAIDEFAGKIYTIPKFRAIEDEIDLYGFKYVNRVVKFSFDQRKASKKLKN
jgi:5'-3' exonuclease